MPMRRRRRRSLFYWPYHCYPSRRCPRCGSYRVRMVHNNAKFFCYQCRDCFHWWRPELVIDGKITFASLK